MSKDKKKKSHLGKGLLVGALFGVAAGIFMSSKEGKEMAQKLQKRSKEIEGKLKSEFKKKKELTEATYKESIDTVLAYYTKSKKIAKSEIPALRKYLIGKWKMIKEEMASVEAPKRKNASPKKKKATTRKKK